VAETSSKVDQFIAEMREYEKHLESEMRRVRQLLNAADGVETRTNTTEVLLEMFQEFPGREFTAPDAEKELRRRGWITESGDPVNAVRAALARLKNSNEIEQVGRGMYRLAEEAKDPWESTPPGAAYDDEPPF
jgi:hypothetical protein